MNAVLLSEQEIHSALGEGLAIEYTRDSPLFRQQITAFQDSYQALPDYCNGVIHSLNEVDKGLSILKEAHIKLATSLAGREGGFSRSLFTNAFPTLGDLSETLRMIADLLVGINNINEQLRENLKNDVLPLFEELSKEDLTHEKYLEKKMFKGFDDYEYKLGNALHSRDIKLTQDQIDDIVITRRDYELTRYDLVSKLNQIDAKKKIMLTQASCNIHLAYLQLQEELQSQLQISNDTIQTLAQTTIESNEIMIKKESLWSFVRARLHGELMGAMPPPGAPPGALSPVQPRWHPGMPVYTATISTEVMSAGTRSATYEDMRHARDDGVFKQGYLYVSTGLFGVRKRKWHRLYTTKLYVIEAVPGALSCNMDVVCNVDNAIIAAKPGKTPHKFHIITPSGKKFEFQAENDDELIKWISALKRCSSGGINLGRPKDQRYNIMLQQQQQQDIANGIPIIRDVRPGPASEGLLKFLDENDNNLCAECNHTNVSWISMSIGVTLCEDCASIHRQLTWAVSKLKNIQLDDFYQWQINLLHDYLGNKKVNDIWEKCVPEGWSKPQSDIASLEEKSRWIMAKYRWYGFVDEFRVTSEEQLIHGIMDAVINGDINKIMWWVSHKATVNCEYPKGSGKSPLHEAIILQNINVVAYLLLNGADMYAIDSQGISPLNMIDSSTRKEGTYIIPETQTLKEISEICMFLLRGDF